MLVHYRTKTQAYFGMITSWDYPAEFYTRLADHWPALNFICSVNEDMGSFGGVVMVLSGEVRKLVEDYSAPGYSRRTHRRRIKKALDAWGGFLQADRDWRLIAREPWEHRSMPFDAHFDGDFWFSFRTREEMAKFRARYGGRVPLRRIGAKWKRTR